MNNASFEVKQRAAAAVPSIKNSGGVLNDSDNIKQKYYATPLETDYDHVNSISIFKKKHILDSLPGSSK
jgi:hypothetical protein